MQSAQFELHAELEEKHQQQSRVLRCVVEFGGAIRVRRVRRETDTSDSPWKTLVKNGLLKRSFQHDEGEPLVPVEGESAERHVLNDEQQVALDLVDIPATYETGGEAELRRRYPGW